MAHRFSCLLLTALAGCSALLSSCESTGSGVYTGRRWFVHSGESQCRFWGYLKKPGQDWHSARLVILDENKGISPPDRPANPAGPPRNGDDHNTEYEVKGGFTGRTAYDPNSDLELPLFAARSFRVINPSPGPLPGVGYPTQNTVVPGREAPNRLGARVSP